MNPMTNVKNIKKLSEQELKLGNPKSSWHDQYKNSAWLFVGGLPYDLSEGDIICVFSQYGEVVNLNLVRDKGTGKSKGFCFLCYEDQRSTNLAVDNFNGIKILGRTIRVDHVSDYKPPKDSDKLDTDTRKLYSEGCAPKMALDSEPELLPAVTNIKKEKKEKKIKVKKEKKRKKKKKKVKVQSSSSSSSESSSSDSDSDTDDSEESVKKRKQSRKKKSKSSKKQRAQNSSSSDSDEANHKSAKTKRQQLEAKIKALEMALSTVKQSSKKAASNDASSNVRSAKFKGDSVDTQRLCGSSDDHHTREKPRQETDRRKHDYEFKRGEEMDSVKSKERARERVDKERRSGREKSQSPVSRERTRDKYKN